MGNAPYSVLMSCTSFLPGLTEYVERSLFLCIEGRGEAGGRVMSKDNGNGNNNYLMLSRKLLSNELWKERRVFSKAEAWIDILFTVRYSEKPDFVPFGYNTLICHRGESLKSIETWATRWGWSKSKVVRFFGMLKKRNMIETQSETVTTRLTVCNYELYNKHRNAKETQMKRKPERKRNGNGTQTETEEEGSKKVGKKKKDIVASGNAKNKDTWITPFLKIWEEIYDGDFPIGPSVGAIKNVIERHGEEKALKGWRLYCEQTPAQYASAVNYAKASGTYIKTKTGRITFDENGIPHLA